MSRLSTKLCQILGCKYPIVQTGMGRVATPELASAASNAGAFGFLAVSTFSPEQVEPAILKTKSLTDKPFGINFQMIQPGAEHVVDMTIKHGLKAIVYSRAPNAEWVARLKEAGVVCMPTVSAVRHAVKAVELGADVITVQGGEGGGHTGGIPTTVLLPQVIDAVDVPVVAAGGFKDGRGLAAALAYGASGIAMGTRFFMTKESPVPCSTQELYITETDATRIPVSKKVDGLPQRMIRNDLLDNLDQANSIRLLWYSLRNALAYRKETGASMSNLFNSAFKLITQDSLTIAQTMMAANAPMMLEKSLVQGLPDEGLLPAGQVAAAISTIISCEQLIGEIVIQAERQLLALDIS